MKKFFEWFMEGSYWPEQLPDFFWLVCKLNLPQLLSGKLFGVAGISSTPNITKLLKEDGRNVVLKMPAHDLLGFNKLSKVLYHPYYMASNNFKSLNRVGDTDSTGIIFQVIYNLSLPIKISEELAREFNTNIKVIDNKVLGEIAYKYTNIIASEIKPIKKFNQFAKQLTNALNKIGIEVDHNNVYNKTRDTINVSIKDYVPEQEWLIKPTWHWHNAEKLSVLNIPDSTEILILWEYLNNDAKKRLAYSSLAATYKLTIDEVKFLTGTYTPLSPKMLQLKYEKEY